MSGGPSSGRHAAEEGALETAVPADLGGPAAARRLLHDADIPLGTKDVVELLTSELVTFCIRHAGQGQGVSVDLTVVRRGDLVRVEVRHPGQPGARSDGAGNTALALGVIDALAPRWGVARDGEGWSGWFEVGG